MRAELVIEAVLAADKGRAQSDGDVMAGESRANKRTQRFGSIGISPAEVITDGDADADLARRPRNFSTASSMAEAAIQYGSEIAIAPGSCRKRLRGLRRLWLITEPNFHGRIAGAIVVHADERLNDTAGLNFMVVLANDPMLAANIVRREYL